MSTRAVKKGAGSIRHGALAACLSFLWLGLPQTASAIDHSRPASEPYKLAGKRMVFSTWYLVRPGQLDWMDDGRR